MEKNKKGKHPKSRRKSKSIKSKYTRLSSSPVEEIFDVKHIPKSLQQDLISLQEDAKLGKSISIFDIFKSWYYQKNPTIIAKQDCVDMITGVSDSKDKTLNYEVLEGSKLALIAYALPYYIPQISTHFYFRNTAFMRYFESFIAESTFLAFEDMDRIIEGVENFIELPETNQIAGFYIRTPVRIWNKSFKRVYKIPSWKTRDKLLNYMIIGNVNVYVMRKNLEHGFELYILFRGTSNEFNGIPQYGKKLRNTQVFRYPEFKIEDEKFVKGGSESEPLFYFYYSEMILDIKPHLYKCLDLLGIDDDLCKRVVISGHSMGGGLAITFAYISKFDNPEWWDKYQFRTYAAPYCCNDAAVKTLEQWIIDSSEPYKFIEVVNTDDFVNVQYMFGGKKGMEESLKKGTSAFIAWMGDKHFDMLKHKDVSIVQKALRIMQLYPEVAYATFMNGANAAQTQEIPSDKKLSFRLGQRAPEVKLWGSHVLSRVYNRTLNVVFCKRRIEWMNEYVGKSHTSYADVNMNLFWSPLRAYENSLYRYYANHSLKENNDLRIVGLFSKVDRTSVGKILRDYNVPLWEPSKKLASEIYLRKNQIS